METIELGKVVKFLDHLRVPVTESERAKGRFPYYGANGVQGFVDDFIFDEPLVLLAEDGGHFGSKTRPIAFKVEGKYWVNNHAHVLRPKSDCNIDYLHRVLSYYDVTHYINGATRPKLTKGNAERMPIPFPSFPEQKRIAAILDKADRLRRQRRFAQTLSDSFLQSVFIKMFGDPKSNPFRWDELPFEEVCEIEAKLVDPRKPIYQKLFHIGGDDIEAITGDLKKLKTVAEVGPISSKFLITPRHILFSKIRPKLRKVSFPNMDALCSADIYPLSVKPAAKTEFIIHYLRGDHFSRIVSNLAETRTNIPKVNRDELAELRIPSPPLPLQETFAAIVQKFERIRRQQREATRQAEHLFQTLLHRAFSGQL